MLCSVRECEGKAIARKLCRMHYQRWKRHGSTDKPARKPPEPKGPCVIENCSKPQLSRGWCRTHYTRWYETGSVELGVRTGRVYTTRPIEDRFWEKVQKGPNHWLWLGGKTPLGYGMIWDHSRQGQVMAHRLSWEISRGTKIPEGMVIDHLCRTPECVNPEHLEVVTVATNTARGLAGEVGGRRNRVKTHCPQGHPYSPENTYYYSGGRKRMCRTCSIRRTQERRRRLAADAASG